MPPKIDNEVFEWLGEQLEPPPPPPPVKNKKWMPRQTRKQRQLFLARQKYILLHGPKGGAKCRTGDAMVYTEDGMVRLGELKPDGAKPGEISPINQPVVSFDGKRLVPAVARGFWVEDCRSAMRCELANGSELTGSPRHPLWVCAESPAGKVDFGYRSLEKMAALKADSGWRFWTPFVGHPRWEKAAYECIVVKVRPTVCKVCGKEAIARGLCGSHYRNRVCYHGEAHPLLADRKLVVDEEISYLLGALVGDGSIAIDDGRAAGFSNIDRECLAGVSDGLARLGARLVPSAGCNFTIQPAEAIKPVIRSLGIGKLSYFKRIPDVIIRSSKPVVAAFLRGLFDTDGGVDSRGRISLVTVSEKLGMDIQDLLSAFGILSTRRRRKTPSGNPTWLIAINGEHAFKFGSEIGFLISRKQARIAASKTSKRCPHGFNHNDFGYPSPIRHVCRAAWRAAKIPKGRVEKKRYKSLCSFGSVPGKHKVRKIIDTFGSAESFEPFLVSDNWLEVSALTLCEAELFDLNVPGPSAFVASGTINHNTYAALDKLVQHCYDNRNALALILVRVQNMAVKGGSWDKLIAEVLPRWREGNTEPLNLYKDGEWVTNPDAGKKQDEGLGLHYSDVKFDANHCPFIWIQNKFGGWSMVTVMSCPHAGQLRQRIRGVEPSIVFLDEATSCDTPEYFESVAAQLGRRPQVQGVQQFIGATNPEDPEHWVYKKWFEEPYDLETGEKDPNFHDIYFDPEDNAENLQLGYLESLKSVYGNNATEAARMIGGQWVSAPSGESLFQEMFSIMSHVRPLDEHGHPSTDEWLMPSTEHPLIVGIDSGIKHHAFILEQRLPIGGKMKWLIFDEVVLLRRALTYATIIPIVMRRIRWWFNTVGVDLPMVWISDDSAMKFFRPGAGTYDYLDMEREYAAYRSKVHLPPMKIRAAPKFDGSVEAGIRIEQTALVQDGIIISARCKKVIAMYNRLENEKQKQGQPFDPRLAGTVKRSDHKHVFDAGVYPKLAGSIRPSLLIPPKEGTQTLISVRAA